MSVPAAGLRWRLRRLTAMAPGEIRTRALREVRPKDNLQVVCRGARAPHLFLCVVRLAGNGKGKLLVRYRAAKGDGGVLTWVGGT
jgi:hypothetical protein